MNIYRYIFVLILLIIGCKQVPQTNTNQTTIINNKKADGYKGIWFTLGQVSEYGDKYSGGLGTYTVNHVPMAIYAPKVGKTFFVYGGTTATIPV